MHVSLYITLNSFSLLNGMRLGIEDAFHCILDIDIHMIGANIWRLMEIKSFLLVFWSKMKVCETLLQTQFSVMPSKSKINAPRMSKANYNSTEHLSCFHRILVNWAIMPMVKIQTIRNRISRFSLQINLWRLLCN